MVYMKSTSSRSYSVGGRVIPANTGTEWLALSSNDAVDIKKVSVIKGLIASGDILVTDKEPAELARTPGRLLNSNNQLANENASLRAELEKLKAEQANALEGNEAAQALAAAQKEAKELKKQLAKKEADYAALKKEAEETIADLQSKQESK